MAHDVFISYSSRDKTVADAACATLESKGIRCWIAPRDILPSADWDSSIVRAIKGSRVMVLVFSSNTNSSPDMIRREVWLAAKRNIPIIPLRVENVVPADEFEFILSTPHWLDAFTPPLQKHLEYLADVIRGILAERDIDIRNLRESSPSGGAIFRFLSMFRVEFVKKFWRQTLVVVLTGVFVAAATWAILYFYRTPSTEVISSVTAQPQTPTAKLLTEDDFQTVVGLSKTSTLDDAVRLHGPYDRADPLRSGSSYVTGYTWRRKGGFWLSFLPGSSVMVTCRYAPPLAPGSPIARLCAMQESKWSSLLWGFTNVKDDSWGAAQLYLSFGRNSIFVSWGR